MINRHSAGMRNRNTRKAGQVQSCLVTVTELKRHSPTMWPSTDTATVSMSFYASVILTVEIV